MNSKSLGAVRPLRAVSRKETPKRALAEGIMANYITGITDGIIGNVF